MTDNRSETNPTPLAPEGPKTNNFSLDVQINNLPFIFQGAIPQKPESFEWRIILPDWKNMLPNINPHHKSSAEYFQFKELGQVGSLYIDPPDNKAADLYITKIKSATWLAPEDSQYYDTKGVGSFLMNNLVALADAKQWSITAFAYTDGRLLDEDVNEWLTRKGFVYDTKVRELVRNPSQTADSLQPIVSLISTSAN